VSAVLDQQRDARQLPALGAANPWLARRGIAASRLIGGVLPLSMAAFAAVLVLGPAAETMAWTLVLCSSTVVALPATLAGRAFSAYNLVVFLGDFVVQWGVGLLVDLFGRAGFDVVASFRGALGLFLGCCVLSYFYFLWASPHNRQAARRTA